MGAAGAGVAGNGGAAGTGAAGNGAAGTGAGNPDGSAPTDGNAGDFPKGECAPGAIFCDGFEEYDPKMTGFDCPAPNGLCDFTPKGATMPTWLAYHFHGPPYVDNSKPFKGMLGYHLNTETGHIAAADILKEAPDGVDLWPAAHYGRAMFQMKAVPPKGPFALISENGLLPGSTTNTAQFTLGSVNGKLALIYTQRKRPLKNDAATPKMRIGGNWENNGQMPTTMCTVTSATAVPAGAWACVEWMFDRTKPELKVWLNGTAVTDLDVNGAAGMCSVGTAATWTGPEHFTETIVGYEMWGSDGGPGAWEAWYDEFAVGTQRLGCPSI
jgi:hypothetical protein